MRRRLPGFLALSVLSFAMACGGDGDSGARQSTGGSGGGGTGGAAGSGGASGATGGSGGTPATADCNPLPRVPLSHPTVVSNEADLRAAIAAGGQIQLDADVTATAPIDVTVETLFDGGGHTISGNGSTHLFVVDRTDFTIQNVTLRDANNGVDDSEHFSRRSGAAIMARGKSGDQEAIGSLTVIDVVFENNRIKASGPGDLRGGAVYLFALPDATISGATFRGNIGSNGGALGGLGSSMRVVNTTFEGNETNGTGPAGALEGHGGAISLDAMTQNGKTAYLQICGSAFRNNVAHLGGGAIYYVSHWYTGTTVVIDKTLFDGNRSTSADTGQGGAIFAMDDDKHDPGDSSKPNSLTITNTLFVGNETANQGGGLWHWTSEGRLTLMNVTFESNRCTTGGNGMGGALAVSRGPADIVNCTFANNWAKFHGGGIQAGGDANVGVTNSLFYNNTSNRDGGWANFQSNRVLDRDGGGNMQFLDPSLEIDGNSNKPVSENVTFADPLLQDLADNGGPTWTMSLAPGSPAIDGGVTVAAPTTDQRGEPRDDEPDVGAFEVQ